MLPAIDLDCPYCGETMTVVVDVSAGDHRCIEDCQVCCRPVRIVVSVDSQGDVQVSGYAEDDA